MMALLLQGASDLLDELRWKMEVGRLQMPVDHPWTLFARGGRLGRGGRGATPLRNADADAES